MVSLRGYIHLKMKKNAFFVFCIFEKYKVLRIFPASFKVIPWKLSEKKDPSAFDDARTRRTRHNPKQQVACHTSPLMLLCLERIHCMILEWITLCKFFFVKKKLLSTFLFIFFFLSECQTLNAFFLRPCFQNAYQKEFRKRLNRFIWNLKGLIYTKKGSLQCRYF